MPQTFTDVVEMLVPELRRRGIFWDDYCVPGGTYRENFHGIPGQAEPLATHPAGGMIWRPSKSDEDLPNGVNGLPNGHFNNEDEELLDPMSMQF